MTNNKDNDDEFEMSSSSISNINSNSNNNNNNGDNNIILNSNNKINHSNNNNNKSTNELFSINDNEEEDINESTSLIKEKDDIKNDQEIEIEGLDQDYEEEMSLQDFSKMIVMILIPVSITMGVVVYFVKLLNTQTVYASTNYIDYSQFNTGSSGGSEFLESLLAAGIVLGMIIITTVCFVLLYKYRCLKILYGWLFISVGMMLGSFGTTFFQTLLLVSNMALDYLTFAFLIYNFTVCGIIAVFWYSHQYVNQFYLVVISILMAISLTRLPQWTIFTLLVIVAIYDLFAVLCPRGPLKVLVELSQERKESIPALVYETGKGSDNNLKLGLGDFIFYSLLISRAALVHMSTVFTVFVAIITGLFVTLLCLAIFNRALPALPISIFLGILFYYLSTTFLYPFIEALTIAQVFV